MDGRMTTRTATIVVFCCSTCNVAYKAQQYKQSTEGIRTFMCQVCKAEVYRWRGGYDYGGWATIETKLTRPKKRKSKKASKQLLH
jgi:hypothetical protein